MTAPPPPPATLAPKPAAAPETATKPQPGPTQPTALFVASGISLAGAIALASVGGWSLTKDHNAPYNGLAPSDGAIFLTAGGVLLASGVVMLTVGLRTPPSSGDAARAMLPQVAVGPTSASMQWKF